MHRDGVGKFGVKWVQYGIKRPRLCILIWMEWDHVRALTPGRKVRAPSIDATRCRRVSILLYSTPGCCLQFYESNSPFCPSCRSSIWCGSLVQYARLGSCYTWLTKDSPLCMSLAVTASGSTPRLRCSSIHLYSASLRCTTDDPTEALFYLCLRSCSSLGVEEESHQNDVKAELESAFFATLRLD